MAIYLSNDIFLDHYKESIQKGQCTDQLIKDFQLLAEKIYPTLGSESHNDKDACMNYAVCEAWCKWNKFDPERNNNIFAFFTSMISNDMKIHYNYINRLSKRSIYISSLENNDKD